MSLLKAPAASELPGEAVAAGRFKARLGGLWAAWPMQGVPACGGWAGTRWALRSSLTQTSHGIHRYCSKWRKLVEEPSNLQQPCCRMRRPALFFFFFSWFPSFYVGSMKWGQIIMLVFSGLSLEGVGTVSYLPNQFWVLLLENYEGSSSCFSLVCF